MFAIDPALQSGPLSFAAAAPLVAVLPARVAELVAMVLMALMGLLAVRLLELVGQWRAADFENQHAGADPGRSLVTGLLVLPVWAELSVHWSHPDDVLAILALLAALALLRASRPEVAAALLGVAVDCKPWALLFLPLLFLGRRGRLVPSVLVFGGVVAAAWAPFLLADSRTLAASAYQIPIDRASVLHLLGLQGGTPSWCRSAQLLLGLTLVAAAAGRGRWAAALVVGVCARMLLDPAAKNYYDAGLVVAASVYDLAALSSIPLLTIAALVAVYIPSYALVALPDERGVLRAAFFLAVPLVLLMRPMTGETLTRGTPQTWQPHAAHRNRRWLRGRGSGGPPGRADRHVGQPS